MNVGYPYRSVIARLNHGLLPPHVPRVDKDTSAPSASIQRPARHSLWCMQSDRDFNNYTNSELRLKSRIGVHDKCISKLLLEYYRNATYSISYSTRVSL